MLTWSSNFRDAPLLAAKEAEYYPSSQDLKMVRDWSEYMISKALVEYFPAMKSCKKYIK